MNENEKPKKDPSGEPGKSKDAGMEKYDINLILDIPLEMRVELGQVRMLVHDLLQLGQGSIIDLKKPVGDQLDIFVGNKLVARGEVVVVEEKFGIRVTDIISPAERVQSLA
jgi:flagellar motor switch protein FliN